MIFETLDQHSTPVFGGPSDGNIVNGKPRSIQVYKNSTAHEYRQIRVWKNHSSKASFIFFALIHSSIGELSNLDLEKIQSCINDVRLSDIGILPKGEPKWMTK